MYYIQTHGNSGCLYFLLPGNTEWSRWSIEYAIDACFEIRESKAQQIPVSGLPPEITETFDFRNMKDSIREVYLIS